MLSEKARPDGGSGRASASSVGGRKETRRTIPASDWLQSYHSIDGAILTLVMERWVVALIGNSSL